MKIRTIHGPVIGISKELVKSGKIEGTATEDGDFIIDVSDVVGEALLAAAFNGDFVKLEAETLAILSQQEPKAPEPQAPEPQQGPQSKTRK